MSPSYWETICFEMLRPRPISYLSFIYALMLFVTIYSEENILKMFAWSSNFIPTPVSFTWNVIFYLMTLKSRLTVTDPSNVLFIAFEIILSATC